MTKYALAMFGLAIAGCGAVGTAPAADASQAPDADPAAPDARDADAALGQPDAAPALAVFVDGPSMFNGGVCSAPGVFGFTVSNGPSNGTFTWTGDGGTGDLVPSASKGAVALDASGSASVSFSNCTPMGGAQVITITVDAGDDVAQDTLDVTIN